MFKNKIKYIIGFVMMTCGGTAYAQSTSTTSSLNLAIPSSPSSFQQDRVRSSDNVECAMAIGSSTNVEFGVVGIVNQNDPFNTGFASVDTAGQWRDRNTDVGVYARITIPIGAPKERLNCNALYKLELEKKRLEVMKLQAEIQQLRSLQFEE